MKPKKQKSDEEMFIEIEKSICHELSHLSVDELVDSLTSLQNLGEIEPKKAEKMVFSAFEDFVGNPLVCNSEQVKGIENELNVLPFPLQSIPFDDSPFTKIQKVSLS